MAQRPLDPSGASSTVVAVRLPPSDLAALDALVASQQAAVTAAGVAATVDRATVLRGLVRAAGAAAGVALETPAATHTRTPPRRAPAAQTALEGELVIRVPVDGAPARRVAADTASEDELRACVRAVGAAYHGAQGELAREIGWDARLLSRWLAGGAPLPDARRAALVAALARRGAEG